MLVQKRIGLKESSNRKEVFDRRKKPYTNIGDHNILCLEFRLILHHNHSLSLERPAGLGRSSGTLVRTGYNLGVRPVLGKIRTDWALGDNGWVQMGGLLDSVGGLTE